MKKGISRAVKTLIFFGILVSILFLVHWELRISAECHFLPKQKAIVRAEVGGILEGVYVKEGSSVCKGDLLFSLSTREYLSVLNKIDGKIKEDEAQVKLLLKGVRQEEVANARKRLEKAVTERNYSRNEARRIRKLADEKLVSPKDLDSAEELLALKEKNVEVAKGEMDLLLAGARPEELEKLYADLDALKNERDMLNAEIQKTEIRSPISGTVTTPYLEYRLHENIEPGTELCEIIDTKQIVAEIRVSEKETSEIRIGNPVKLKARGFPGESFYGYVTEIAAAAQTEGDRRIIRVLSELGNPKDRIKPGMTGNAKIECGERTLWHLATRRAIRYLRTEFLF
jgi:multidrug resistance efflux pump